MPGREAHHFILSRGDALGFTIHPKYKERGRRPRAVETGARLFHYCSLKSASAMRSKREAEGRHWSERMIDCDVTPDMYYQAVPRCFVGPYRGTHPAVVAERIDKYPLILDLNSARWRTTLRPSERKIMHWHRVYQLTGGRGFRRGCYKRVGRAA